MQTSSQNWGWALKSKMDPEEKCEKLSYRCGKLVGVHGCLYFCLVTVRKLVARMTVRSLCR